MNSLLCSKKFTSSYSKKITLLSIALFFTVCAFAQNGIIKGSVQTSDGKPAEFVNIAVQGTNKGATVNKSGNYTISIKPGAYVIIATYTGFNPEKKAVELKAGETVN